MEEGHNLSKEVAEKDNTSVEQGSNFMPLIACCPDLVIDPVTGALSFDFQEAYDLCEKAIKEAGGLLYLLKYSDTPEKIRKEVGTNFHGLLIPGGRDINPKMYHEENCGSEVFEPDAEQRWNNHKVWLETLDPKVPVLGICYGMQVINCLFGGKMIQDLGPKDSHNERKNIMYKPGSFLGVMHRENDETQHALQPPQVDSISYTGQPGILYTMVGNCYHHQACKNIPACFDVVAWDEVEKLPHAIEYNKPDRKIMGVQWHPEYTFLDEKEQTLEASSKKLFRHFVNMCREYASTQLANSMEN